MYHRKKSLGLILGGGELTRTLINNCKKKKIKIYIIAIKENYSLDDVKPDIEISFDKIASIFSYLKKKNITQVILLGSIKKKPLFKIRPNFITFFYLLKIFLVYAKGDGELINKVLKVFQSKNIDIIDPRTLLKKNLCNSKLNNLIKFKKYININKIKKYFILAKRYGQTDKGQAIIISDGKVLFSEDSNGTDCLINKFKYIKKYKFSCLVKVSKPNQDIRVDLPTIGPKTIENMVKVGINGIIVEHERTFIESPVLTFKLIKRNNILFYAY